MLLEIPLHPDTICNFHNPAGRYVKKDFRMKREFMVCAGQVQAISCLVAVLAWRNSYLLLENFTKTALICETDGSGDL